MTPAEQPQKDVAEWLTYHQFVPDGTAGEFCGSRSPGYEDKCKRRQYDEIHSRSTFDVQSETVESNPYLFNPPTASEWAEASQDDLEASPWSLRRQCLSEPSSRKVTYLGVIKTGEGRRYFKRCARIRCGEEIPCYRVVTGSHTIPASMQAPQWAMALSVVVEDAVYYWADDALVLVRRQDFTNRLQEYGFHSYRCLSLWARGQESE